MAVFNSYVRQRDFSADVQYSGQRDRGEICRGRCIGGGRGVLSDHDDIYGYCGGKQYRMFRHYIESVRSKEV